MNQHVRTDPIAFLILVRNPNTVGANVALGKRDVSRLTPKYLERGQRPANIVEFLPQRRTRSRFIVEAFRPARPGPFVLRLAHATI